MTKKQVPVTKRVLNPAAPEPEPVLTNRIALVVDSSGSMQLLRQDVIARLSEQVNNIKAQAHNSGQRTFVSVYQFSGRTRLLCLAKDQHPEAVPALTSYYPDGQTALLDAIQDVARDLESQDDRSPDTSFLMIVLTDGEENDSYTSAAQIQQLLRRLQGTDRWTFAMLMPPGGRIYAQQLGIPDGNIQEWEGTRLGLERASRNSIVATTSYYATRALGQTATRAFFADLSGVTKRDLNNLDDLTGQFRRIPVTREEEISALVERSGVPYQLGKGYYQLTKAEKVQSHKDLVIEDRATKRLFGGDEARRLVGIATGAGVTVRVNPGNLANYNLFVQSTSMNRKLVRGTTLLYRDR